MVRDGGVWGKGKGVNVSVGFASRLQGSLFVIDWSLAFARCSCTPAIAYLQAGLLM